MKKKSLALALLMCVLLILSACGSKASSEAYRDTMIPNAPTAEAPVLDYDKAESLTNGSQKPGESSAGSSGDIYTNDGNKIIRTANMTIQTTAFDEAVAALNRLTGEQGGYFESAEVSGGGYYDRYASRSAYYVIRIPKENFVAFRDGTGGIGHVYSMSENSQDVGEAYYDTEARLATLTTKRDRLLALLEKAEYMEDIISLENALADVQYEIDMHTSTLRRYDSLIGYSTFHIRLNEVIEITETPGVKESFGSRLAASFKAGFKSFGEGVQNFVIWMARNLMGLIIFAAVVAVVVIVVRRCVVRRRKQREQGE